MTTETRGERPAPEEMEVFDAFTAEDSVVGDMRDPYPRLDEARRRAPVTRIEANWFEGAPGGDLPVFSVLGFEAVEQVLRDAETFSSAIYEHSMGPVMGHTILEMDAPEHLRHRALIAQAFRPRALLRWEDELIGPLIHELIDGFVDRGRADLMRDFVLQYPMKVIARILGLPREDWLEFMRLSFELVSVTINYERGIAASQTLREYFGRMLDARRQEPEDDLISELVKAEVDGQRLTDDEILPFLLLLLPAGAETTLRSLGNLLYGLLTAPDQLAAVQADRSLLAPAIEEGLRWEPPLELIARLATRDTEVCGVAIPAGSRLIVHLGAAARDDTRWEQPARFDHARAHRQHLAFGTGPHMCLGMHLARLEMHLAAAALLDRLPGLRLDPDAQDVHIHGMVFRSPPRLPVVFSA